MSYEPRAMSNKQCIALGFSPGIKKNKIKSLRSFRFVPNRITERIRVRSFDELPDKYWDDAIVD